MLFVQYTIDHRIISEYKFSIQPHTTSAESEIGICCNCVIHKGHKRTTLFIETERSSVWSQLPKWNFSDMFSSAYFKPCNADKVIYIFRAWNVFLFFSCLRSENGSTKIYSECELHSRWISFARQIDFLRAAKTFSIKIQREHYEKHTVKIKIAFISFDVEHAGKYSNQTNWNQIIFLMNVCKYLVLRIFWFMNFVGTHTHTYQ